MSDLFGTMVETMAIKAVGDLFHESFKDNPHTVSDITPDLVHGCDLHEGSFGTQGSVITWHYTHDGKRRANKCILEVIDEEKKSMVFKSIDGDLLEIYKSFVVTYHVDDTGDDNHLVTWTIDYEKKNEDTPEPTTLMDFFRAMTKDMEDHHHSGKSEAVVDA